MFRGSYQRKLLTILQSGGSNPLEIWNIQVRNGWTRRLKDDDMGTIVFEIAGTNVATAYIVSPPDPRDSLGIALPYITMIIKNLKRYFTFEIQILDDKKMRRRFRFSNYQSSTKVRPFTCSVPLSLKPGWNQMQLNLANFTSRAYGSNYMETQRVQIHANCRIRRIFFSDRLYTEEELPRDYRIYLNVREAYRAEPPKKEPPGKGKQLETTPSTHAADVPIPSQPSHDKLEDIKEDVIKQTSFKSIPSAGKSLSIADSKSLARKDSKTFSVAASKSALSVADKKQSKSNVVTEGNLDQTNLEPSNSKDAVKTVSFTSAVKDELTQEADRFDSEQPPQSEFETPEDALVEESIEAESPRTEPTESEYAESEPIPDSDVEHTEEIQLEPTEVEPTAEPVFGTDEE